MEEVGPRDLKIYFYDVVDSTQDLARSLGAVEEFTVVVAREQIKGRGRLGRGWYSPPGGLWFTIILYPKTPISTYAILCLLCSLSIVKAIEDVTGLKAHIKWPNDVYLKNKKIAGILVESDVIDELISRALVGIGVNLNFQIESLPEELRDKATTLLEEYGETIDREVFLIKILKELKKYYEEYRAGAYQKLVEVIKSRMEMIGRTVSVSLDQEDVTGLVKDLEITGNLIIESTRGEIVLNPSKIKKLELI
ncbi:MAG: biotin--[acetyl-CoA-carboxylase] ligase [Aigarchaeota archaeon]|nr:biotin--[acetyl-CoA-carboxylase] ligase [Aigarchaeota archaeon]